MAKYFAKFPKTYYKLNSNVSLDLVTNVISRYSFEKSLKENTSAYYYYQVRDGDTPEIIAHKIYGSAERHWIILSYNDILDPQFDWPLKYDQLNQYIENKYATVSNVSIINGGTGYSNGYINFTTADSRGRGANAYYTVNSSTGAIQTIELIDRGTGYKETPNVIFLSSNGSNANISVSVISDPIVWAKNNIKSYYKIETITTAQGVSTSTKIAIDANTYANLIVSVDNSFTLSDNNVISIQVTKETQNYYDYELELNDKKRDIKILDVQLIPGLESELREVFQT